MADTEIIPVIDIGPYLAGDPGALDRTAEELRFALTEIGFYVIVNHGAPATLIRDVYREVARFHAQPIDKKLAIKLDKHNVGYLPMMGDTLRTSGLWGPLEAISLLVMFSGAVFLSHSPLVTGIRGEGKGAEYEELLSRRVRHFGHSAPHPPSPSSVPDGGLPVSAT